MFPGLKQFYGVNGVVPYHDEKEVISLAPRAPESFRGRVNRIHQK